MKANSVILFTVFVLLTLAVNAQTESPIVKQQASIEDIINVMEQDGTYIFSFDMTGFNDKVYYIVPFTEEYRDGVKTEGDDLKIMMGCNKTDVRKFGPKTDDWRKSYGMSPDENIHVLLSDFAIYIRPVSDSVSQVMFNVKNIGIYGRPIKKDIYPNGESAGKTASYGTRPFALGNIERSGVIHIPLVMMGSFWYDERANVYRFCGEKEISPDLSSEILKNVPHYYVFGIELHETEL